MNNVLRLVCHLTIPLSGKPESLMSSLSLQFSTLLIQQASICAFVIRNSRYEMLKDCCPATATTNTTTTKHRTHYTALAPLNAHPQFFDAPCIQNVACMHVLMSVCSTLRVLLFHKTTQNCKMHLHRKTCYQSSNYSAQFPWCVDMTMLMFLLMAVLKSHPFPPQTLL